MNAIAGLETNSGVRLFTIQVPVLDMSADSSRGPTSFLKLDGGVGLGLDIDVDAGIPSRAWSMFDHPDEP